MNEVFSQNPIYFTLAIAGTLLYVLKMFLFSIGGDGDAGSDLSDVDRGVDGADGGESFSLVSTQSILAFLMGTGWIGLTAKRDWQLDDMVTLFIATGFGFIMMLFSSFLTFKIKKLNSTPEVNIKETIGKMGRAYTNIPERGEGIGQVEITVGGKQQILQASSIAEAINSFDNIKVVDIDDSGDLIVQKI